MATAAVRPDLSAGFRQVLHGTKDRDSLVKQAKDHAQQFEDGLKSATRGIAGARFDAVRAAKDPKRLDEKVGKEGQPIHTVPDVLAGRISVDSPEAHTRTAESIHKHFKVIRDLNEFDKGDKETGYRVHKLQVQVTPELSAETHIVPKEVMDANAKQHGVYEDARDAEVAGNSKVADQKYDQAKEINDQAMSRFQRRNGGKNEAAWKQFHGGETNPQKPETKPTTGETKYKSGTTQANLPKGSEAAAAIAKMARSIPSHHLAGDGKDVDEPHVTIRYGLKDGNRDKLRDFIRGQHPFTATLGKTGAFPPSENSDGAAPIHAPVEAPELHRLNSEIEKHGDFEPSSFPTYKPHVTVAYVKPEVASRYVGNGTTAGKQFRVSSIAIGDRDGTKEVVPMQGTQSRFGKQTDSERKGGRGESPEQPAAAGGAKPAAAAQSTDKSSRFKTHGGGKWVGTDLDGTLAKYDGFKGPTVIGDPIPKSVARVQQHLKDGHDVRIVTARVSDDPDGSSRKAIEAWSQKHIGKVLPITDRKDHKMQWLEDDRAVQVARNEGTLLGNPKEAMAE